MKTRAAAGWALWLVVPGLVLLPVLRGQTQFFYRDVTRQYAPLQAQLDRAWARQELPVWNASTQSGVPLLANLHAGVFAPWAPVFRVLEFHRAYGALVALAWAAWMAGLYCFLRGRLARAPSFVGALTGGLGGVVLGATSYLPLLAGLACVPWQLVALRQPRPLTRVTVLAVLFTLQVLMGDPSTALMGGLACLVVGWLDGRPGSTRGLLPAVVMSLGLSALQLLPAWTLYEESARALSTLDSRLAWSFHPARTLEWVVRLPFGALLEPPYFTRWDLAAGPDAQPFLLEHGWGLLGVLMLGAALTSPGPLRRAGVGLVLVGFGLSLGRHLGPLQQLFALPPFSLFRYPERYGALTTLGIALLSAHGAAALLERSSLRARWAAGWLVLGGVLAAAGMGLGDERSGPALLMTAGLVSTAGLAALVFARVWWAWLLAVLCLGALEGVHAVQASVLTLPTEPLPAVAATPEGGHRVWRENGPLRGLEQLVRGAQGFAAERRALHQSFASATPGLHDLEELGGYSPVSLRRWQRVISATTSRPELLSSLFDVGAVVSTRERAQQHPEWNSLASLGGDIVLSAPGTCRGRAWTVARSLDVPSTDDALQVLLAPGFDPFSEATREGGGPLPPLAQTLVTPAPRTRASQLELTVEPSPSWALVVVSETWAPGWSAWVDGVERPVELLDGTLLGVAVPPGGRAVTLRYEEPLASTGLAMSAATALLLSLAWLRRR